MREAKERVLRYFISCGSDDKDATVRALALNPSAMLFYDYDVKKHEFSVSAAAMVYEFAKSYVAKYNEPPTKEIVLAEVHSASGVSLTIKTEVVEILNGLHEYTPKASEVKYNIDLLGEEYIYHRQLGIINAALDDLETKPKSTLSYLQKELSMLNIEAVKGEDDKTQTYEAFIKDALLEFQEQGKFDEAPIPFGFSKMDFTLGGMHPGEFIVIVGPTGVGKSFFAGEITYRAGIDKDFKVAYANREMLPKQTLRRILARQTQIPARKLRDTSALNDIERNMLLEYMQKVSAQEKNNLLLIPPGRCATVPMIKREIELYFGSDRPDLIVVDYLEEIQASKAQQSTWETVRFVAQELKDLAVEFACPVLTLAQLNAEGIKNPDKAELIHLSYRDIAKKADGVFLLFADKDNPPRPPLAGSYYGTPGVIKLRSVKYRNEATGLVYNFDAEFSTSSISESEDSAYGSSLGKKVALSNAQPLQEIIESGE